MLPKMQLLLGSCQSRIPQGTWRISEEALMEGEGGQITGAECLSWGGFWECPLTYTSPDRWGNQDVERVEFFFFNICPTFHQGWGMRGECVCVALASVILPCVEPHLLKVSQLLTLHNKPSPAEWCTMMTTCSAHRLCGSGIQGATGMACLCFTMSGASGWWVRTQMPGRWDHLKSGLAPRLGWPSQSMHLCATWPSYSMAPGFPEGVCPDQTLYENWGGAAWPLLP